MSISKLRTQPDFTESSPLHKAAMEAGKDHFSAWQYNVADKFKGNTVDEIKSTLKETCFPFAVAMENLIGDFNFGTLVRNANAFNAREVFYLGDKKWDRRSALGTYNYTDVKWISHFEEFEKLKDEYTIIGIDNVPGSVPLHSYNFVENTLLVFGSEGTGLTPAMQKICKDIVHIEQYGSVRSLNVGTASGIIMYDCVQKMTRGA